MFGYVPGGYARIIKRFGEVLAEEGIAIRLCQAIKRITSSGGRPIVELEDGTREIFDRVVLTVTAPVAARLCPELSAEEKSRLEGVQYQGIICASLLLKKPLADFYVTNITETWVPFTAVIEMSALVNRAQFGGNSLVYLPKYLSPDDPAFSRSDEEIEEEFLGGLERMYPDFKRHDLLCFRLSRVRHVFPIPTLNYSERLPPMVSSMPGVYLVNSSQILNGTLNVNETVQLAERAAGTLMAPPHCEAATAVEVRREQEEKYGKSEALGQPVPGS